MTLIIWVAWKFPDKAIIPSIGRKWRGKGTTLYKLGHRDRRFRTRVREADYPLRPSRSGKGNGAAGNVPLSG